MAADFRRAVLLAAAIRLVGGIVSGGGGGLAARRVPACAPCRLLQRPERFQRVTAVNANLEEKEG